MNKCRPNKSGESGITLIALIIMIILIVILASVTIRGITEKEGMLSVAETSIENYKVKSYEEKINQNATSTVIRKSNDAEK